MQQHLFWSEKTLLIELDWVTLCEVELVNTARLVNTGVMTTACTPWPPSCPRFNQHPHTPIYSHSSTTASKLSLFFCFFPRSTCLSASWGSMLKQNRSRRPFPFSSTIGKLLMRNNFKLSYCTSLLYRGTDDG